MPTEPKRDPGAQLIAQDDLRGDKDAIASAAEAIRAGAATHAASVTAKARERDTAPGTHMIPIDGETADEAGNAMLMFEKARADKARLQETREADDDKTYRYYLKCRDTPNHTIGGQAAPDHGIYLKKKPVGLVVKDGEWFSAYKPKAETVWHGQEIPCQACLKMGISGSRLPYEWVDRAAGTFRVDPRWVWKAPKNYKLWVILGDTRAFDLPSESSNNWRAEHEKKLEKARQEGVLTNG